MTDTVYRGRALLEGQAAALVLRLDQPISFWGGVDPHSGRIIDPHHPQCGESIRARILVLPGTRGSTAAPGALLETLAAGNGPAAIVLTARDNVCLVAVSMAELIGIPGIPLLDLSSIDTPLLQSGRQARINAAQLSVT